MIKDLNEYDEAVAAQLAALLWKDNKDLNSQITKETLDASKPETKAGFERVWKETRSLAK